LLYARARSRRKGYFENALIGDVASAGQKGGANYMRVSGLAASEFMATPPGGFSGIVEYITSARVPVSASHYVGG
jgi:hypothetical protein